MWLYAKWNCMIEFVRLYDSKLTQSSIILNNQVKTHANA